ncbi:hypothetical protein EYF80_061218 [Liparis tanakae]|uniref:Uncharacterized protein n=1 Tax=Liparis tanakae TaxID=230148 RepID=A0A4Z2EJM3_9TELE|nr:hypothetical protein EYF80_061218 [Liparis tanakae]
MFAKQSISPQLVRALRVPRCPKHNAARPTSTRCGGVFVELVVSTVDDLQPPSTKVTPHTHLYYHNHFHKLTIRPLLFFSFFL